MSVPKRVEFTSQDYWALPDGVRAELVDGKLYDMTPPSWMHQKIALGIAHAMMGHIERRGGECQVAMAPIAVNLDADDTTWVEPDVVVVCDPSKISERGVEGPPDMVVEVVSPSSVTMDYFVKAGRYERAGVREYWIVDPSTSRVVVYRYGRRGPAEHSEPDSPQLALYPFSAAVPAGVLEGLSITVQDLLG